MRCNISRAELVEKLREWRLGKSVQENVKLYMILQNKTIDAIVDVMPQNKEEFIEIKGLGERKFEKYGEEILGMLRSHENPENILSSSPESCDSDHPLIEKFSKKVLTVSQYLDLVNQILRPLQLSIRGEISRADHRNHLYFSLKDLQDESKLDALMWESDLKYCAIKPEEGLEVVVHGFLEIYKPSGKATFHAQTMELVGEGALKKAYDELKEKLSQEGLFDEKRKKTLPEYPVRLGVITSRYGAVIHDLLTNLGNYGYHIRLFDARVEGASSTKDLAKAIEYFRSQPIDALLVIRGGGSLESLQAFNSEMLVRSITNYPVPVIAGIGHDKDVPLFSLAADAAFSTPTAVAREINQSWERAIEKLRYYESSMVYRYAPLLLLARNTIEKAVSQSEQFYGKLNHQQHILQRRLNHMVHQMDLGLKKCTHILSNRENQLSQKFSNQLQLIQNIISIALEGLKKNDPQHQLKKGYSIVLTEERKILKSVEHVRSTDTAYICLSDGSLRTVVEEVTKRRDHGRSESDENPETSGRN